MAQGPSKKRFSIYIIRRVKPEITDTLYIGQTCNFLKRMWGHKRNSSNPNLRDEIMLWGEDAFTFVEIAKDIDERDVDRVESRHIRLRQRRGYNVLNISDTPARVLRKVQARYSKEELSDRGKRRWAAMTPERRSEIARKTNASMSPEQRSERLRKANALRSPEQRSEIARKRNAALTDEQRSEISRKRWAAMTPQRRKEIHNKRVSSMTVEARSKAMRKANASRSPEQKAEAYRKCRETWTPEKRREWGRKMSEAIRNRIASKV